MSLGPPDLDDFAAQLQRLSAPAEVPEESGELVEGSGEVRVEHVAALGRDAPPDFHRLFEGGDSLRAAPQRAKDVREVAEGLCKLETPAFGGTATSQFAPDVYRVADRPEGVVGSA